MINLYKSVFSTSTFLETKGIRERETQDSCHMVLADDTVLAGEMRPFDWRAHLNWVHSFLQHLVGAAACQAYVRREACE